MKAPFTIIMPMRSSEIPLMRRSLPSCYSLGPSEVILCLDNEAKANVEYEISKVAFEHGCLDRTRVLYVKRNYEYSFHQAWVRREGFRNARWDRILTVDVDLKVNRNVLKTVKLVGNDDVGFSSCIILHHVGGLLGLWRAAGHRVAEKAQLAPPAYSGLYSIWRPFWIDSEDDGIEKVRDPRQGTFNDALMGEDTYLCRCMAKKHRCVFLTDVGAYNMRSECNDLSRIQFEIGRKYAKDNSSPLLVLARSLTLARFHYIHGYLHEKLS